MKIKLFLFASFIYIMLIFAFAWYLELGYYTLNIYTKTFELPVMIWLIIPLCIYAILSVFHMTFYSFLRYLKLKHFFKDAAKFENYTQDLLLQKDLKTTFQTKEFRTIAQFFKTLKTHEKIPHLNKINEILDLLDGLNKNEYFNLSKFKLQNNNALFLQNEKNRLKNDINYAYTKVKNLDEIKDEYEEIAFNTLIQKANYEQIKNIKIAKKPCHILTLIKRFKEGNLELNAAEYEILLSYNKLSEEDYLNIAKLSTKLLNPDALIGIFSKIKNEKSEALKAYLYLLAELGLLDELRGQIHNDKKFNEFQAFLILREKNIKIDLNQLIQ
ncbi:hypothetical protein LNU06_00505 [Campylobacter sp. VicNov18]|uniref:hypothetical protein n=1 Tax=Campylobacter bilis TaxID=2691918 RepID=UPI00130EC69B|nr:hypothetical protein [Campylobacter bilis]MPV63023.1 hypothetical protein [Campylobacter hepaticus]MBM0636522.1 hypothetical protein [Campylobacter bilis]MCC8277232.1 hypothetical protein [Campylobacter bilis]MCC8298975.1 hypothetical protein [Campylobacter bilis]MCC8300141.1 hypothetical protein [Campylobacter bilis]